MQYFVKKNKKYIQFLTFLVITSFVFSSTSPLFVEYVLAQSEDIVQDVVETTLEEEIESIVQEEELTASTTELIQSSDEAPIDQTDAEEVIPDESDTGVSHESPISESGVPDVVSETLPETTTDTTETVIETVNDAIIEPFVDIITETITGIFFRSPSDVSDDESITDSGWNYISRTEEATTTSEIHAKWINYLSEGGWKPINTDFVKTKEGFVMKTAPFEVTVSLLSTGQAVMHNNNRYDVFTESQINETPLDMRITALGVREVSGKSVRGDLMVPTGLQRNVSYVVYEGAYDDADLIYYVDFGKAPRLEKLIRFKSEPTQFSYSFDVQYSDPVFFDSFIDEKRKHTKERWDKSTKKEVLEKSRVNVTKEGSDIRGIGFKEFQIWDSNTEYLSGTIERNIKPIRVEIEPTGTNRYTLTKILPQEFFATAVYPVFTDTTSTFYPDPDAEVTTVDGQAYYVAGTSNWDTAHDSTAGTGFSDSASTVSISSGRGSANTVNIVRSILLFDTSSIPDNDWVSSSTLSLYTSAKLVNIDDGNDFIVVVSSSPAANTSIQTEDYDLIGDAVSNPTEHSSRIDISSGIVTSAYNNFILNGTGRSNVNLTGVSKFGAREGHDILDIDAYGNDQQDTIEVATADASGTSTDPKLLVEHLGSGAEVSGLLQSLYFFYDAMGNIISLTNHADTGTAHVTSFTYDNLYRLTMASTTNASSTPFLETYAYSWIGNILNKSDLGAYLYDETSYANPHAVTDIASTSLTYDNNGNMLMYGTSTYAWDYRNRLATSTTGTATTTYGYDHNNMRVWMDVGGATTTYPNMYYNVQGGTTTNHVYLPDGTLIATIGSVGSGGGSPTNTGLKSPASEGEDYNAWTNGQNATSSNNVDTFATNINQSNDWYTFGLSVPSGATINGIEVLVEAGNVSGCPANGCDVGIALSWNGGTTYTTEENQDWSNGADTTKTYGGTANTWGRTWSDTELSDANFRVRGNIDSNNVGAPDVDHIQVRVTYTESGGGGSASSTISYIHTDHLGGTNVVTDQTGTLVEATDYYPFGKQRIHTTTGITEQKKFTGHEYDVDSDLTYARARYYEQDIGKFLSIDPLVITGVSKSLLQDPQSLNSGRTMGGLSSGFASGWNGSTPSRGNSTSGWSELLVDPQLQNSYSYARNNPLIYNDPNGEFAIIPAILLAYSIATLAIDAYDLKTMTYDYPDQFSAEEKRMGAYKIAIDLALGGIGKLGTLAEQTAIRAMTTSLSVADHFFSSQIYGGVNFNLIQSQTSIQGRQQTVQQYNSNHSPGFSAGSSGGSSLSGTLWTTPSGAVVTWEGQLVAGPTEE